jgi:polysaccharide pyruvyl transferase WcaK-like protein
MLRLHTEMLVFILGFPTIPIVYKWKFNAIYNNTKMTRLQTKLQVMIIMNVLFVMHWIVGGIEMEM